MRKGYIYKITSPKKRVYIGQTMNVKKRFGQYKRLNCESQFKIYNSLKKYGPSSHVFEVLTECDVCEMNKMERYFQDLFHTVGNNGLNLRLTATNVLKELPSKESRERMSIAQKKQTIIQKEKGIGIYSLASREKALASRRSNPIKRSEEFIINLIARRKGAKASIETRAKMSLAKNGVAHKNKRAPKKQEQIDKHKLSLIGKYIGEKSACSQLILNTETGIYYYGTKSAADTLPLFSKGYVEMMIAGSRKNKTSLLRV